MIRETKYQQQKNSHKKCDSKKKAVHHIFNPCLFKVKTKSKLIVFSLIKFILP